MFAPKTISFGCAPRKSASAAARGGNDTRRSPAGRILPVGVGVVLIEVVGHGLDDGAGYLGAARSIEIGDGVPVMPALEGQELGSNL